MPKSHLLGLGGFLIGLGIGWYVFTTYQVSLQIVAWILIVAGSLIVATELIAWRIPHFSGRRLVPAIMGGLILSLFLTNGYGLLQNLTQTGTYWPYTANTTKSYPGSVTTNLLYLEVRNINGPVTLSTWNRPEYSINLTIKAGGFSQNDANNSLSSLNPSLSENIVNTEERLVLQYGIQISSYSRYSISVTIHIPSNATSSLKIDSSNGHISLANLEASTLMLETSNAPIIFSNVATTTIEASTSNARIEGTIQANVATFSTSNAPIALTIISQTSGEYTLQTSNAAINLKVSTSPQIGYSLNLSTSNSNININLQNLDYTLNQNNAKKAQTVGFNTLPIQTTIIGITSNAAITVNSS